MSCGQARIPWRGRRRPTPPGRSVERSRSFAPTARSFPRASPRAWTPACIAEPEARPPLAELHRRLEAALPSLNGERPVPAAPVTPSPAIPPLAWLRASQLVALTAWGLAVTLVAAPLGRPGLALVLGALTAPAILVASRLAWAPLPVLAPLLGALSPPRYTRPSPGRVGRRSSAACWRRSAGAGSWWARRRSGWGLASASSTRLRTAGAAPRPRPPARCCRRCLTPEALFGAVVFALAAVALGTVLRAGHVAVALLGVLLWSAGLEAALGLVADGGLSGRPLLIAAAALVAVILEFRRRPPRPAGAAGADPRARPAIQGGGPGGMP